MTRVAAPQAGEDPAHSAEVLIHPLLFGRLSFFGELSGAHALCKKWRKGMGSWMCARLGLRSMLAQYSSHLVQ